jgi:hypothetical protein
MMAVGSCLLFLSAKYNEGLPVSCFYSRYHRAPTKLDHQWDDAFVIGSSVVAVIFAVLFIIIELFVAPEPVLAPALLKQPIPMLVGCSNFLVATCNFSIMYFLPMWFQTVCLTSASIAGAYPRLPYLPLTLVPDTPCYFIQVSTSSQTVSLCPSALSSPVGLCTRQDGTSLSTSSSAFSLLSGLSRSTC